MIEQIFGWVEIPLIMSVVGMLVKDKKDAEKAMANIKDALAEFKLHVARNYASLNALKDVENRLTDHLLRIEKKLDEKRGKK